MSIETELDLPGTRRAFRDAIHGLAGRTTTTIIRDNGDQHPAWGDSLYQQVKDAIARNGGAGASGTLRQSMAPAVIDAIDLLDQIDRTVRAWSVGLCQGATLDVLHALEDRTWRPQDCAWLKTCTQDLIWWRTRAQELLDPPRRWSLPSPCPECNTTTVYRQDSAGETVRQPALQIGEQGCVCQQCRTFWPPERFGILAGVLGITRQDDEA